MRGIVFNIEKATLPVSTDFYKWDGTVLTIYYGAIEIVGEVSDGRRVEIAKGAVAHVILGGVFISLYQEKQSPLLLSDSSNITLTIKAGTSNTLKAGSGAAGIQIHETAALTIGGSGSLLAFGGTDGAGIGGGLNEISGVANIVSGTIIAAGSEGYSPGIGGGGSHGGIKTLTISGGNVTAIGGPEAPGIGGGFRSRGGLIYITGGMVDAVGGDSNAGISNNCEGVISITDGYIDASCGSYGAGIGGGMGASGGRISISGGTITARGGEFGAGIGGGGDNGDFVGSGGDIVIYDGVITAIGGDRAAGIGGGNRGSAGNITIDGGTLVANGGTDSPGIGGGFAASLPSKDAKAGMITINEGVIKAFGGVRSAGIGNGYQGSRTDIAINGGIIRAQGDKTAPGIGGGDCLPESAVIIRGGTVKAITSPGTCGIASDRNTSIATVAINGNANVSAKINAQSGIWFKSNPQDIVITGKEGCRKKRSLKIVAEIVPQSTEWQLHKYQWYQSQTGDNAEGLPIPGANEDTFPIPESLEPGTYYYFCEVSLQTNKITARSAVAEVTVREN